MFATLSAPQPRLHLPPRHVRLAIAFVVLLAGFAAACARDIDEQNAVHILTADAQVNPVLERYLDRGIDEAEDTNARAVVIQLDTPGGLVSSMQDIIQRIESSEVPVIVWVAPSGAQAASAGTFITMIGHVAAMAPSTRIGAASPVGQGGEDIDGTIGRKVVNDLSAYARAIAEERGRNVEWAERAVRQAVAASATEAVDMNIVDFIAADLDSLLEQSEGMEVTVRGEDITLNGLTEAQRVENDMTLAERVLLFLSDPTIAFLLLTLGGLGLLIELLNPGIFAPGVFGVIMLILAFFALGTLPVNWAGVALIILAFAFFAGEFFIAPGFGALGAAGAIALIAGGLLLTTSDQPDFQVSRWVVVVTGVVTAVFFFMVATAIIRSRNMPVSSGIESMIGGIGTARSYLNPEGFVFYRGERWRAVAEDAPIDEGANVEILEVKGLTLTVRSARNATP